MAGGGHEGCFRATEAGRWKQIRSEKLTSLSITLVFFVLLSICWWLIVPLTTAPKH